MNNVVNLNKFRKKKKREKSDILAEENRAKFGRTKEQKRKDESDARETSHHLDAHKLDNDET